MTIRILSCASTLLLLLLALGVCQAQSTGEAKDALLKNFAPDPEEVAAERTNGSVVRLLPYISLDLGKDAEQFTQIANKKPVYYAIQHKVKGEGVIIVVVAPPQEPDEFNPRYTELLKKGYQPKMSNLQMTALQEVESHPGHFQLELSGTNNQGERQFVAARVVYFPEFSVQLQCVAKTQDQLTRLTKILNTLKVVSKSGVANGKSTKITVKEQPIVIPFPSDFVPKKRDLPTYVTNLAVLSPKNTVHQVFASADVTDETVKTDRLRRHADVQTIANAEVIDEDTFGVFTKVMSENLSTVLADALKDIEAKSGVKSKASKFPGQGKFIDAKNRFAYLGVMSVSTDGEEETKAFAQCLCHVKGRLLSLNVHSKVTSDKDVAWVRTVAEQWLAAIVKANE